MHNSLMLGLQTQRVLQRRMDIAANNLANVATAGFKADAFGAGRSRSTPTRTRKKNPRNIRFVRDIGLMRDMSQGPIAIDGQSARRRASKATASSWCRAQTGRSIRATARSR